MRIRHCKLESEQVGSEISNSFLLCKYAIPFNCRDNVPWTYVPNRTTPWYQHLSFKTTQSLNEEKENGQRNKRDGSSRKLWCLSGTSVEGKENVFDGAKIILQIFPSRSEKFRMEFTTAAFSSRWVWRKTNMPSRSFQKFLSKTFKQHRTLRWERQLKLHPLKQSKDEKSSALLDVKVS